MGFLIIVTHHAHLNRINICAFELLGDMRNASQVDTIYQLPLPYRHVLLLSGVNEVTGTIEKKM